MRSRRRKTYIQSVDEDSRVIGGMAPWWRNREECGHRKRRTKRCDGAEGAEKRLLNKGDAGQDYALYRSSNDAKQRACRSAMPPKFLSTYVPLVVFPAISAAALKLIFGSFVASGLDQELRLQCPTALSESMPYRLEYLGLPAVDGTLCALVAFFHLAFTPAVRPLLTYFFSTSIPLLALPALEAVHSGRPAILALPVLLGLAGQMFTVGATLPLYWLLFILSGAAQARPAAEASQSTMISTAHVQAVSFGIIVGAGAPSLFPVWQFIAQMGHLIVRPPPKSGAAANGFGWVQALYVASFIVGSSIHLGTLAAATSWRDVFLPSLEPRVGVAPELKVLDFLQWDCFFGFSSTLLATLWFARTASQALTIALWNVLGSVIVGPGATIAAVALWRESYLHTQISDAAKKSE
ncbi:Citreoviridin biosynthesis protein D [Mycena sanguinolenta]|uniref:Citreoviridin biosynthesis protein D n=1 Tax=Mycena sanguinolenta TaxID=230812 RepID=A0A8H6YJ64_9AGAR|nr:Citreoviridin biosynthesis protein D [Mycena sanguinolenta]